ATITMKHDPFSAAAPTAFEQTAFSGPRFNSQRFSGNGGTWERNAAVDGRTSSRTHTIPRPVRPRSLKRKPGPVNARPANPHLPNPSGKADPASVDAPHRGAPATSPPTA